MASRTHGAAVRGSGRHSGGSRRRRSFAVRRDSGGDEVSRWDSAEPQTPRSWRRRRWRRRGSRAPRRRFGRGGPEPPGSVGGGQKSNDMDFGGGGAGRSRPVRQPILAQCRIESDLRRGQRMGTRQIRATGSAPVVPPAQTVWRTVGPPPGRTRQPPHGTRFRRNWLRPGENHRVTCAVRERSTSGAVSPRRFLPAPRPAIRSSAVVGPDGELEFVAREFPAVLPAGAARVIGSSG